MASTRGKILDCIAGEAMQSDSYLVAFAGIPQQRLQTRSRLSSDTTPSIGTRQPLSPQHTMLKVIPRMTIATITDSSCTIRPGPGSSNASTGSLRGWDCLYTQRMPRKGNDHSSWVGRRGLALRSTLRRAAVLLRKPGRGLQKDA